MKHFVRIGLLGLAVGMFAALALAAPAPTRAGDIMTCESVYDYCLQVVPPELLELCLLDHPYWDGNPPPQNCDFYCPSLEVAWEQCIGSECVIEWDTEAEFNAAHQEALGFSCEGGSCGDGRVNTNCSAPEIVYCNGDDADFYKYNYGDLEAYFHFSIPLADLQQSVAVKTLVKKVGTVSVYLMPDGRTLLVAQQTDLKDYFMFWDPSTCASIQEGAEWGID